MPMLLGQGQRQAGAGARESAIIDKGMPTAGLVAHTLVGRFVDHLPYYRLEQINARSGVVTPTSTSASCAGGVDAMSHGHLRYRRSRHVALRQHLSLCIRAVPAPSRSLLASHRVHLFLGGHNPCRCRGTIRDGTAGVLP